MPTLTASNIVSAIAALPRNVNYNYIVTNRSSGLIHIESVIRPEGPITIKRWKPSRGESILGARAETISSEMIWRVANAFTGGQEGTPINIDRVLGASYNTRSVLESLLAHTPEFYYCYPGRIQDIGGHSTIERGHKHLLWLPSQPHEIGILVQKDVEQMAISEIPQRTVVYDNLVLPENLAIGNEQLDINVIRRHTQIQIALYLIGLQLGYRTWIAQNDQGIIYNDEPLISHQGIVSSLSNESIISAFPEAENSARFIDVIWFQNHRFMPAVMEVEHTTGVTSGLTRMQGLQARIPAFHTRYVIVAPDDDRDRVITEINRPQFRSLDARFFPYSSVEELYYICTHRALHGVTQDFLDCYMEKALVD